MYNIGAFIGTDTQTHLSPLKPVVYLIYLLISDHLGLSSGCIPKIPKYFQIWLNIQTFCWIRGYSKVLHAWKTSSYNIGYASWHKLYSSITFEQFLYTWTLIALESSWYWTLLDAAHTLTCFQSSIFNVFIMFKLWHSFSCLWSTPPTYRKAYKILGGLFPQIHLSFKQIQIRQKNDHKLHLKGIGPNPDPKRCSLDFSSFSLKQKKDRKTVWLISKGAYSSFYQDFVAVFICCWRKNQMVAAWWCMWVKMRHHLACTVGDEAKVKQWAGLNVDQARPCALQPERQCFSSSVLTWRLTAAGPLSVALPSLEPSGFPQFTGGYSDICGQDSEY